MKVCITALLGVALFLALATPSFAAPSGRGHLSTQVSNKLQFFMSQFKATFTKSKLTRSTSHEVKVQVKSLEDLDLDSFLNYLRWLSAQDAEIITEEALTILGDLVLLLSDILDDLQTYFLDTPLDLYDLADEYYDDYYPALEEFIYRSEDFWRSWIDDKEHIPQNLVIYLPHIQAFLQAYGGKTFAFFTKVEEFTRIFLTPENLALFREDVEVALKEASVLLQRLKAVLSPPSGGENPLPPKLTVEGVIGFWKYIGELNATSIIVGGLDTIVKVRDVRHQFEDGLALIFWEANELDLVYEAQNLTGNLQVALDSRQIQNRLALDTFIYQLYHGDIWALLEAFVNLLQSWIDGFNELPDITLATVEQLQALAQTLAPEYLESAQVLTQESLDKLSALLQAYFANFRPQSF